MSVPAEREALPGYIRTDSSSDFMNTPIGDRPLTVFEEANMLLLGWTRDDIFAMTPLQLDAAAENANLDILLGS